MLRLFPSRRPHRFAPESGASRRIIWLAGLAYGVLFRLNGVSHAQALETENAFTIKAAFLLNFAKYTEWPPGGFIAANSPVRIGILGEDPFGEIMEATVKGVWFRDGPWSSSARGGRLNWRTASDDSRLVAVLRPGKRKTPP